MAEEVLVNRPLLPAMITGGEELVRRLARDNHKPNAAFWIQEVPEADWKLVVAYPDAGSELSFDVYKRVLDRAPETPGIYWPAIIRIEDATHSLIKAVKSAVKSSYGPKHTGWANVNLWSSVYQPSAIYVYHV